jgi:hypothetical protein
VPHQERGQDPEVTRKSSEPAERPTPKARSMFPLLPKPLRGEAEGIGTIRMVVASMSDATFRAR